MLTGFCYLVAALSITEGDSLNTEEDRVGIAIKTINKEKIQIQNCKQNLTN